MSALHRAMSFYGDRETLRTDIASDIERGIIPIEKIQHLPLDLLDVTRIPNVSSTNILVPSLAYKPFRYPLAYEVFLTQNKVHWMPEEVPLADDVRDWHRTLTDGERNLVTHIFRLFTQNDDYVNSVYLKHYAKVFGPSEVLMAIGAISNIECFDTKTELLTSSGWKKCADVTVEDTIAQYDLETGAITWTKPSRVIAYHHTGVMHHYTDKTTDICVTPNHDLILKHPSSNKVVKNKSENGKWGQNYLYPTAATVDMPPKEVDPVTALLIATAADGTVRANCPSGEGKDWYTIDFSLTKPRKRAVLERILDQIGLGDVRPTPKRDRAMAYTFSVKSIVGIDDLRTVKDLDFIKLDQLSVEDARAMVWEFMKWDGSLFSAVGSFYSTRKAAVEKFQAVCVLAGYSASVRINRKGGEPQNIMGRITTSTKDCYVVNVCNRVWRSYPYRKEVPYDDMVHCVTVPKGNVVSRRNGKVAITGNCTHQASYSYLLDTIGMPETEYSAFMSYKAMSDKYDYMQSFKTNTLFGLALAMVIFGGIMEGVQLFASFAMLMNFQRDKKGLAPSTMKGMGQIVTWSQRDESLHCAFVAYLFRSFMDEFHSIINKPALFEAIIASTKQIIQNEHHFIDLAFEMGPVPGMSAQETKDYVEFMADKRLEQFGLPKISNIEKNPIPWVESEANSMEFASLFEQRGTNYSRGATQGTWDEAFSAWKSSHTVLAK